ncbi:MAG TPA: DUF6152 family protein [Terriglobales bacterium]|nr:DUF6152 family protein [Terriglobales bacterium]
MKTMVRGWVLTVLALVLLAPTFTWAHHGTAAYDDAHPVTMTGTVTEFNWGNPHVQIYYDVKSNKGEVVHWSVETLSPGKLARLGWSKDSLKTGDQITITVWAAKNGAPVGFMRKLVVAGGKELHMDEKAN